MPLDVVNLGSSPTGEGGDSPREAFTKINNNVSKTVEGPSAATDGAVALFDGTTGKLLEDGPVPGAANGLATLDSGGLIAPDTFARLPWYDELVVYDSMKSSSTVPLDEFVTPLGGTWNVLFGIWNRTVTGAATSGSGGGSVPDNYHLVVLDVGVTNFVAEYATGGGLSIRKSFVFAVIDRSNYLEVQIDFNQLRLRKIAAGVTTNLVQVTDVFPNSGGPYVLRVSKRNARIVVAPEGSLGLTHTLSAGDVTAYGSATQLGWYGLDTDPNGRARNLIVRRS